jgi:hypothetical protein
MATVEKNQSQESSSNGKYKVIGTRPIRHDGVDKVTGRARYGGDTRLTGMLPAAMLRSPHAHAKIISVDTSKAAALPGVRAVVTSADLPDATDKIADLGAYWTNKTRLPLPVGLNIIHRDLSMADSNQLCDLLRESLLFALENRQEALDWACEFGRGKEGDCGATHIEMFANTDSVMMPDDVRLALASVFQLTQQLEITQQLPPIDIVDGSTSTLQRVLENLAA